MSEAQQLNSAIQNATSILIGTHLNPDGDALGCALAMSLYLDSIGKPNEVLCHHAPPKNLEFLPGSDRIRQVPQGKDHDLAIMLDLESLERLGTVAPYFENAPHLVLIDHHIPHHAPGDLRIVDTKAPATAVILTRLLIHLDATFTPEMSTNLLTGIVTDTGSFRYRNTTPEAMHLAARLLEEGGDLNRISEEVYRSRPMAGMRLLGVMLSGLKTDCADRLAWSVLDHSDFIKCGATEEDTEEFVNELLTINTVQIAALLRESKPGKVRVSLRSRGKYDVASVAREFGGGGHINAAGCSFESTPEEAEALLVEGMKACLGSC
ncbi:MAG: bifunctional oligoribonuclease and phosphatase NrnA [Fimbriimonadaceae bacterium]|jgi:phosphoesterase RecJ-like protein|nr:bifunctional oligoribonuclease and phosphatase NrnA [Fimbriimonadaceae bacterium]